MELELADHEGIAHWIGSVVCGGVTFALFLGLPLYGIVKDVIL